MRTYSRTAAFVAFLVLSSNAVHASPPKILHQAPKSVIVRLGASSDFAVWQVVGDQADRLFTMNLRSGKKSELKVGSRPFAPAVAGSTLLFGTGRPDRAGVEVYLSDLKTGASKMLHKLVPWTIETGIDFAPSANGDIRAVWERSVNDDGENLSVFLYEGKADGRGRFRRIADGPIFRKDLPREYYGVVHHEYPKISGDAVVFQSNEFGVPNTYRLDLLSNEYSRLSPSARFQERPAVAGPYSIWEESESGFATSDESAIVLHDMRTGRARKINAERGFHYWPKLSERYAVYGAKRAPMEHTPSLRVYDLEERRELTTENCFVGAIYDHAIIQEGVIYAQRMGNASRLLLATWDQLRKNCL